MQNPIVRRIMKGFSASLSDLVEKVEPKTIHEVGCGEGYWVIDWNKQGIDARGSDFSDKVISLAKENAKSAGLPTEKFSTRSIYEINNDEDSAELVVCCEVLEHLEDPKSGLEALHRVANKYVIVSVPREPIWRALNLARGKYIGSLGNTPGHIQHWSSRGIIDFVGRYFEVVEVKKPLPWTMMLCRIKR
ncbi:class I SAM-dependent methyltransferase [Billgrantia sulfidoxydans]|nr:class I SAM-dependent methyltransferase [Halomonas sulfidoxydans]